MLLLSSADIFQNKLCQKILSGKPSECQMIWIQIKTYILLVQCFWSKLFAKVISRRVNFAASKKDLKKKLTTLEESKKGLV